MNRMQMMIGLLALCSTAAYAQVQSVEVRGQPAPARSALQQLCPDIYTELPDDLARTAQEVATAATVRVQFEVDAGRIRAVQTQGGVPAQARAVRRAVSGLQCAGAGRHLVQMNVRFLDPFDRRTQQAAADVDVMAVLVEGPAARR
jgi:hypothetical protein